MEIRRFHPFVLTGLVATLLGCGALSRIDEVVDGQGKAESPAGQWRLLINDVQAQSGVNILAEFVDDQPVRFSPITFYKTFVRVVFTKGKQVASVAVGVPYKANRDIGVASARSTDPRWEVLSFRGPYEDGIIEPSELSKLFAERGEDRSYGRSLATVLPDFFDLGMQAAAHAGGGSAVSALLDDTEVVQALEDAVTAAIDGTPLMIDGEVVPNKVAFELLGALMLAQSMAYQTQDIGWVERVVAIVAALVKYAICADTSGVAERLCRPFTRHNEDCRNAVANVFRAVCRGEGYNPTFYPTTAGTSIMTIDHVRALSVCVGNSDCANEVRRNCKKGRGQIASCFGGPNKQEVSVKGNEYVCGAHHGLCSDAKNDCMARLKRLANPPAITWANQACVSIN
ncbi:MAG: hypothetical protein H6707_00940 [Deltaproteobacteria bacterium]|nr:hypothetical protein [Deltaproteobacteria bacterium]